MTIHRRHSPRRRSCSLRRLDRSNASLRARCGPCLGAFSPVLQLAHRTHGECRELHLPCFTGQGGEALLEWTLAAHFVHKFQNHRQYRQYSGDRRQPAGTLRGNLTLPEAAEQSPCCGRCPAGALCVFGLRPPVWEGETLGGQPAQICQRRAGWVVRGAASSEFRRGFLSSSGRRIAISRASFR